LEIEKGTKEITKDMIVGDVSQIIIPNSVVAIGPDAFRGSTKIEKIVIPQSVLEIGGGAFRDCTGLKHIMFSSLVVPPVKKMKIGDGAFRHCTSLIHVPFTNIIGRIGEEAFFQCSSMRSVEIRFSVEKIGAGAFEECTNLQTVRISTPIVEIEDRTFQGCVALKEISIPDSIRKIGADAFRGCGQLKHIDIPDSLLEIGNHAFHDCSQLEMINIPDTVEKIGMEAFAGCVRLTTVVAPTRFHSHFHHANFTVYGTQKRSQQKRFVRGQQLVYKGHVVEYDGRNDGTGVIVLFKQKIRGEEETIRKLLQDKTHLFPYVLTNEYKTKTSHSPVQNRGEVAELFSGIRQEDKETIEKSFIVNKDEIILSLLVDEKDLDVHSNKTECTTNRLVQFTGTCYMNSVLNALFMPVEIRNMIFQSDKEKSHLTPYQMRKHNSSYSIQHIFYSLVHILKQGKIVYDQSLIDELAYKIKRQYLIYHKDLYEDKNKADGGFPILTLSILFDSLHLHCGTCKYDENGRVVIENNENRDYDLLMCQCDEGGKVERTLTYGGRTYILRSGIINVSFQRKDEEVQHSITGYICKDKREEEVEYIFDSNNYIVKDIWIEEKNRFKNYKKLANNTYAQTKWIKLVSTIYVREEIQPTS